MKRLWSTIMVLFAVFALTAPTLAAGYVALRSTPPPRAAGLVVSPILNTVLKPCQVQGGKRVLPCHTNQAILAQAAKVAPVATGFDRALSDDHLPEGRPDEPILPPPRLLS
jgi:hypothetical protein